MLQQARPIPLRLHLEEEMEENTIYLEYVHCSRGYREETNPVIPYELPFVHYTLCFSGLSKGSRSTVFHRKSL